MPRGTKRKTTHNDEIPKEPTQLVEENDPSQSAEGDKEEQRKLAEENRIELNKPAQEEPSKKAVEEPKKKAGKGRAKRAKISKPEDEDKYLPEKRSLEDLWEQVFPVGTAWDELDMVYQYKWNFSTLEDAYEEGGVLYNQKVYLFGCTEAQMVSFQGQHKFMMIPVVVAVVSPFPPSDQIGITSVQMTTEEILPMKQMKMDWVPYIPLEKRGSQVERLRSQIFILRCTQRRAGVKHLKLERLKQFEYCLPFFYQPLQEDELKQSTVVQILFPIDPKPVFCEFDWEFDELEEFTDKLVVEEQLSADKKDEFKDFLKEKVREEKKANREAREARKKALEEMSPETKSAFENMKFYKFYPVSIPDKSNVSIAKSPVINRYYGKAHKVL